MSAWTVAALLLAGQPSLAPQQVRDLMENAFAIDTGYLDSWALSL